MDNHKQILKYIKFTILVTVILFSGCQGEYQEEDLPEPDDFLEQDSQLKELLVAITLHDGSFDNLVDEGSCLSIIFPYTVYLDDRRIEVLNTNDLEEVKTLADITGEDVDLDFPVRARLADHQIVEVTSEDRLEELSETCTEGGIDDDIECLNIIYPLRLSYFDRENALTSTVEVSNDSSLYMRLRALPLEGFLVSIIFPFELTLSTGERLTTNAADEATDIILVNKDECDEMDQVDYEEDDRELPDSALYKLIEGHVWSIDSLIVGGEDISPILDHYSIDFQMEGIATIGSSAESYEGYWSLSFDSHYILEMYLDVDDDNEPNLPYVNGSWIVSSFDSERLFLVFEDTEDDDEEDADSEDGEEQEQQYLVLKKE